MDIMKATLIKGDRVNLRDRRGHYASGNLDCLRDQYWAWNKEPITNPTDFKGAMKMLIGSAIEDGLVKNVLSKLGKQGYFLEGTQVAVGGSNPNWDGYLDGLMSGPNGKFVIEIKTASGYGADLFARQPQPKDGYMVQLGLYLKDCHEKGVTRHGLFIFILLSDNHFGEMVFVNMTYNPENNTATAERYLSSEGHAGSVNMTINLDENMARWNKLEEHIKAKTVPAPEYQYKYPITHETVRDIPDTKLKKIIEGSAVHGDWQPLYSRYKNKALEVDGIAPQRTEEEIKICLTEYRRRHPRTKL